VEPWFRDEAVILFATFGACALLILGVLELLWPSRRRADLWAERRSDLSRERLSALAVAGQQPVGRESGDQAPRVADLR
jgi:hypothetical protein